MSEGPDISNTELIRGGSLDILVRRPQITENIAAHPALIMLHGYGANESDIYELVPFIDKRVLVVAARGAGVAQETARGSYKWYDWTEPGYPEPELWGESLKRLASLVSELPDLTQVKIESSQIFMGGFSQGAAVSLGMAANYPQLLAGIIAHSGFVSPETAEKLRNKVFAGKSAFVAHGVNDGVLTIDMGRAAVEILKAGDVAVTYKEYPFAHETSPDSRRDLADWLSTQLHYPATK